MSFSGKKVFITSGDTRVGRVLGRTFRDAGCAVYGLRTCRDELDFAAESYFADYVVSVLLGDCISIPILFFACAFPSRPQLHFLSRQKWRMPRPPPPPRPHPKR